MKSITIRMGEEEYRKIETCAVAEGVSLAQIVQVALRAHVPDLSGMERRKPLSEDEAGVEVDGILIHPDDAHLLDAYKWARTCNYVHRLVYEGRKRVFRTLRQEIGGSTAKRRPGYAGHDYRRCAITVGDDEEVFRDL